MSTESNNKYDVNKTAAKIYHNLYPQSNFYNKSTETQRVFIKLAKDILK